METATTTATPKNVLRETTHKQLSKQSSDQLFSKLKTGSLKGMSIDVAIDILKTRKFDGDLSKYERSAEQRERKPVKTTTHKPSKKPAAAKKTGEKKTRSAHWTFGQVKLERGQKATFAAAANSPDKGKTIHGEVVSAHKNEKGTWVRLKTKDGKKYWKKLSEVKLS